MYVRLAFTEKRFGIDFSHVTLISGIGTEDNALVESLFLDGVVCFFEISKITFFGNVFN